MSNSSTKSALSLSKKLLLALGSATIFLGVALYMNKKFSDRKNINSDLIKEIFALGNPKKDKNGLYTFDYFKNIMNIAYKYAAQTFAESR